MKQCFISGSVRSIITHIFGYGFALKSEAEAKCSEKHAHLRQLLGCCLLCDLPLLTPLAAFVAVVPRHY